MTGARALFGGVALAAIGMVAALSVSHVRPSARSEGRNEVVVKGPGGIPLVKADPDPVKIKPKDPGGLKVPHKNMTVYERLEGSQRKVVPAGDPNRGKKPKQVAAKPGEKKLAQDIGPYRAQLGSYSNADMAERRWRELQKKHPGLFGSLHKVVERVNVRSKGTLYRLQAGPLKSPEDVQKLCAALAKHKIGCFLIKS